MKEELMIQQETLLPEDFCIKDASLFFNELDLLQLAKRYGTPLRLTYLPTIAKKIDLMKAYFQEAIYRTDYQGLYSYFYCTKSSHFQHVLKKALQSEIGIEISSAYDTALIKSLIRTGDIPAGTRVICNGYKTPDYQAAIIALMKEDYCAVTPIVDSLSELQHYLSFATSGKRISLGIRLNLSFLEGYANESRFGLAAEDIIQHYTKDIQQHKNIEFTTLHFFNEKGMDDNNDYWAVLAEVVQFYCRLKRLNPKLNSLDIGGGMPFQDSTENPLAIQALVFRIVSTIQNICREELVPEPNIITEFGKYTVAEATNTIFKLLEKKPGDTLNWAIIDGSFITHLPDTWAIQQSYPVLPVNNMDEPHTAYTLGGLTCDSADFYPNSKTSKALMLPDTQEEQFVAFLHTGAYQEALSGFGGVNHCLIPSPKHIIIDADKDSKLSFSLFAEKQSSARLLDILGYAALT